ncbi:putative MFS family arabinose efflux permease [Myceligenerans xiligouense]|uniref:Putative MFS family arabinose efflux permease n=1 Tax=Myceligenerans xiligouense TaxID=253184 RepID=A0A3N4ZMX1_9MICO|nr:putative MFS family arabinose efflux permease [Myceligenerans xiligouense]
MSDDVAEDPAGAAPSGAAPPSDTGRPAPPAAEIARNFRAFLLIWVAQMLARIGNGLTGFGLGVHVYQQTSSSTAVAAVTLAAFLPGVLLTPFAGVLADRFDRRLLMILSDTLSAVGLVLLLVAMATGYGSVAVICACVALSSVFTSVMDPAYRATVSDLLTPEQYARAGGMVQLAGASQFLLSPAIAGVIMVVSDVRTVIVIDLATMVVTIGVMLIVWRTVRARREPSSDDDATTRTGFWEEFRFGVTFLARNQAVTVMMLLITLVTFCMGFLQTLLTPMVLDLADEEALGVVRSVAAVGMIVASIVISVFGMGTRHRAYMAVALAFGGVVVAGMGITENVLLIGGFGFLFFLTLPVLNTSVEVLVRSAIPNETQGRVWGLVGLISQLGYIAAYAVSGVLADYVFNPLLLSGGALVPALGDVIGVGESRGIGLMFIIVGLLLIVMAVVIYRVRSIRTIEGEFARHAAETERH